MRLRTIYKKIVFFFIITALFVLGSVNGVNAVSPAISAITLSGISTSTATISWTTGTEAYYVYYSYDPNGDLVRYERSGNYKVWHLTARPGARSMEFGADNKLYIGTCGSGQLLQLDPQSENLKDLGKIDDANCIMSLSRGPDDFVYGGTYPGLGRPGKLFRIDTSGNVEILGTLDPNEAYNAWVVATPDGWVYNGIGVVKSNVVAYNPRTKEFRNLMPDSERVQGATRVFRAVDNNAYAENNKKYYRLLNGTATLIDKSPAMMPRDQWSDGTKANVPPYPGNTLPVFLTTTGPDGKIYMSGSGPEYIARFDPATGQTTKLGIIPSGGEAYSMIAAYGKLFIASYPHAILHIYDPTKPFNPSPRLTKTDNPAYYGSTAPNQDRPRAMVKGNDGRIYMANHPTYGYLGGAISWYDPVNDSVGSVPTPVPNQSLWSLASLPDGTIAIGTDIDGGPGTVPTATQTKLCVWNYNDPTRCQWEGAPLQPGNTGIKSLALGGDNLLYGAGGKQVFAFNPATRTILATTTFPQGGVLHRAGLMTLADGRVVALTASSATFVKYNSSTTGGTWTFKTFAKGTLTSGGAILGDYLYAASGKALVRVRIPSATATTVANFEKVGSVIGLGIVQGGSMVAPGPGGQADSQVEYGLTTAYGLSTPIAPTLVSAHSISLANLTLDTLYHYRVKSRDASGNLATSEDATFRTAQLSTIDTTPPQISNVNASASVSSITVTWQTNEQTDSKVEYGTSATYGSAVSTTTLWTSHSLVLPNLSPDTLYHYRVKSKDASGNESQSSNNTIRTVSDTPGSCTPSSINNGTVSPYPSCTISCNSGYRMEGSVCVVTSTGGGGGGGSGGGGGGGGGSTGGGGSVTVSSATIERLATNILSAQKALLDLAIIKKTSPNDPSIPGKLAEIQKAILEITQELQQILSSASTSGLFSFSINLSLGSYNNDVHELQRILAREKFYFGSITGYFGPVTRAAVIRFQRYFGILPGNQITPGLGLVGPLTRMKLNELLQKP